ncbi:MAG: glycosyltransferase [Chitinophagaceae bacterium]
MQNILFVITKSEVGGAQKFVQEQIVVCSSEFNVYLCTNKNDWLTKHTNEFVKDTLLSKAIESKTSVAFLFKLMSFIKKNKIDLVITNSANAGFYGRLAAFFTNTKSCYYSHGWSSVYNGGKLSFLLNFIEKLLALISTKVICVSQSDYCIANQKIGIPKSKLQVVKNATLPLFAKKQSKKIDENNLRVLTLARFAHPKRIDLLVEAFKQVKFANLHIAGGGPDFAYWSKYIKENKIKTIELLGEIPSFSQFFEYDVFILISDSEGLPISAIEAMSAGLPLILSNVGGCNELINNNGISVKNNKDEIIKALENVNVNYELYQANSIVHYNLNFNLETEKVNYLKMYKSFIN